MKEKVHWFFYPFIFFVGYGVNFLIPVEIFFKDSHKVATEVVDDTHSDIVYSDKNIRTNVARNPGESAKRISFDVKPAGEKSPIAAETTLSVRREDPADLQGELAALRDYRMQAEIKKHEELLQVRGSTVESLNDSFKSEPVDAAWAEDKEKLINHLVEGSEYLSQVPHMDSECRSTQCKFSVLSDDQFYLTKLSGAMDKVVADQGSSFSSYTTIIDEKTHTTSIYFERN